jgi:hypothetical protein
VQDEWNGWEHLPGASLKKSFVDVGHYLEAGLDGAPKRDLSQKLINLVKGGLDPMTLEYVSIRFNDPDVALVRLAPKGDVLHSMYPRVKLQAIQKINGEWQSPEDWSGKTEVSWCRDKRDERIEELVLIYSNSHAGDAAFERDPPASVGLFDEDAKLPKFTISNAACMPWHGTTTVTVTNAYGGVIRSTGNVTWKEYQPEPEDDDDPAPPMRLFVPESGTVGTETHWIDESGCTQDVGPVQGPVGELEGQLAINFDQRQVIGYGLSTIAGASLRMKCPGADEIVTTGPVPSNWLKLPLMGTQLGEDGRTIEGSLTEHDASTGTTTTAEWHLDAKREE